MNQSNDSKGGRSTGKGAGNGAGKNYRRDNGKVVDLRERRARFCLAEVTEEQARRQLADYREWAYSQIREIDSLYLEALGLEIIAELQRRIEDD